MTLSVRHSLQLCCYYFRFYAGPESGHAALSLFAPRNLVLRQRPLDGSGFAPGSPRNTASMNSLTQHAPRKTKSGHQRPRRGSHVRYQSISHDRIRISSTPHIRPRIKIQTMKRRKSWPAHDAGALTHVTVTRYSSVQPRHPNRLNGQLVTEAYKKGGCSTPPVAFNYNKQTPLRVRLDADQNTRSHQPCLPS